MTDRLVGMCGLVCSECGAFKATKAGDTEAALRVAAEWSAQFHVDVALHHVWCDGCTPEGRKCAHCGECGIRACGLARGHTTCADCPDFPCAQVEGFFAMVPPARDTLMALRG